MHQFKMSFFDCFPPGSRRVIEHVPFWRVQARWRVCIGAHSMGNCTTLQCRRPGGRIPTAILRLCSVRPHYRWDEEGGVPWPNATQYTCQVACVQGKNAETMFNLVMTFVFKKSFDLVIILGYHFHWILLFMSWYTIWGTFTITNPV